MTSDASPERLPAGIGNVPPAAHDDYEPPRRRRWPWILLALLLAFAGVIALLPSLISTSWLNEAVRTWLRENVATPVEFRTLEVSWSRGVRLTGLEIRDAERTDRPLLYAPLVELDASIPPLLARRLEVRRFVFENPVVTIRRSSSGGTNTEGVVRTKRVKRGGDGGPEALVLPEIDVPVEVHGLTLAFVEGDDVVVEQSGVEFAGHLTTRAGPTTFRLRVPQEKGGLSVDGEATLFDPDGALLPVERIAITSHLRLEHVDARDNRDLLALFLGQVPTAGVLDGKLDIETHGMAAQGTLELALRGVALGAATGTRDASAEDLRVTASFSTDGEHVTLRDAVLRGDGLDAHGAVTGTLQALDGELVLGADIARSAAALRAIGFEVPDGAAGRVEGRLVFRPQPARADGTLRFDGLRLPRGAGAEPFVLDHAEGALAATLGPERITVESLTFALPEARLAAGGSVGRDGSLELRSEVHGDVSLLVARARALGVAPEGLAVAGALDIVATARRADASAGLALGIESARLAADGFAIDATGALRPDGTLDFRAQGSGALEKLLEAGGTAARAGGVDLRTLRGTFDFAATAGGTTAAPRIALERLRLDGDLHVDATGGLAADRSIVAQLRADGRVRDVVALARGLGLYAGDVPLDGRITAEVQAAGSLEHPEIPRATLRLDDGPVTLDASAAVDATRKLSGSAQLEGDLDALFAAAHTLGHLKVPYAPGGRLRAAAVVAGTLEAPEVPTASLALDGPVTLSATASLDAVQSATARVQFSGRLRPLGELAAAVSGGEVRAVDGDYEGTLTVDGALERPQLGLPRLLVRSHGLTAKLGGTLRGGGAGGGDATFELNGPVQALSELLAELGIEHAFSAGGQLDVSGEAKLAGTGDDAEVLASLNVAARQVRVARTAAPERVLSDEELRLSVPTVRVRLAERRVASGRVEFSSASGLRFDAVLDDKGSPAPGAAPDLDVKAGLRGPLQAVVDLLAFVQEGSASPVQGSLDVIAGVTGTTARPVVSVSRARMTSPDLAFDATAERNAAGHVRAKGTLEGALAPLVALARAAGAPPETDASGRVTAAFAFTQEGESGRGSLELTATEIEVRSPPVAGGVFREPKLTLSVPEAVVAMRSLSVAPFDAHLTLEGLDLTAKTAVTRTRPDDAPADAPTPLRVDTEGRVRVESAFARNHPELLPDTTLERIEGPFRFHGDVARGREDAAAWTGGFELQAAGVKAPYVDLARASLTGALAEGTLVVAPIEADVNGGTARGEARIGLVGEKPEHTLTLHAEKVQVRADLAPMLSRAAPILAVGETGRAGGVTGMDVNLKAKGLDADTLKRSVTGEGTLALDDVFAESDNWIGTLLELTGAGKRLAFANAKVPFTVKRGHVTTGEVALAGSGLDLLLGGTVGLDGALDYGFKVKPKAAGGTFEKYAKLLDKDGYLPLRLEGAISDPDIKFPKLGDALKEKAGGLLDDFLNGRKKKPKKAPAEGGQKAPATETPGSSDAAPAGDGTAPPPADGASETSGTEPAPADGAQPADGDGTKADGTDTEGADEPATDGDDTGGEDGEKPKKKGKGRKKKQKEGE